MKNSKIHPVNEKLPLNKILVYGFQHVLAMYSGAVAVLLVIGGALNLTQDQIIFLINANLFTCGIATIIQTVGFYKYGIKLPVIQGVTFVCVQPIIAIATGIKNNGFSSEAALVVIYISIILAGFFTILISPIFSKLIYFFPPIVTGSVILSIGLSLVPVGLKMLGGQGIIKEIIQKKPIFYQYGSKSFLFIGLIVIILILLCNNYLKGFWKNISILIGLSVGYIISFFCKFIHFDKIALSSWIGIDLPFGINMPGLNNGLYWKHITNGYLLSSSLIPSIISMIIVMIIVMVESTGDFIAIGEIIDLDIKEKEINAGLKADGLSTVIGGFLNAFPYSAFAQNVGLLALTKIKSRWVVTGSGFILIILGLIPKLGAFVESIPRFVIGSAAVVMFAMVAANGIKTLSKAELDSKPNNLFIIALTVIASIIPYAGTLLEKISYDTFYTLNKIGIDGSHFVNHFLFFNMFPKSLEPLLSSGTTLAAITAISLNILFNGLPKVNK